MQSHQCRTERINHLLFVYLTNQNETSVFKAYLHRTSDHFYEGFTESHLPLHFFSCPIKITCLNFVSAPKCCPQQDFHKFLCFCSTFRTLPCNNRMAGHTFYPCSNYLTSASGYELLNKQWIDQWTDEKILTVRFSHVPPSFWHPIVVKNPALELASF